jgi:hypothetical protein
MLDDETSYMILTMKKVFTCSILFWIGIQCYAQSNVVVYRLGNGSSPLSPSAAPAFLDEYNTSGVLVRTIAMPTATSGANAALTNSGTQFEGILLRSTDKRYLTVGGYDAAPGTGLPTTNRAIGRIDKAGVVNTTTRLTSASIRSALTDDGTRFWTSVSTGGIYYITLGVTGAGTEIITTPSSTRAVNITDGQLYVTSASSNFPSVSSVGIGIPTTSGQTASLLNGLPSALGPSPTSFVFLDLNTAVVGNDALYIADDRTIGTGGGLQRWNFNGTSWTLAYTLNAGLPVGLRSVIGDVEGGSPVFYGVTSAGATNTVEKVTDTGAASSFTTFATAATNTAFRGVAFAPEPGPVITTTSPSDNSTNVAVNSDLSFQFDQTVQKGTGNILIKKTSDNSIYQTIDVTSSVASLNNDVVTIATDFDQSTGFYIIIPSGAFKDSNNVDFAGILTTTEWNFTTGNAVDYCNLQFPFTASAPVTVYAQVYEPGITDAPGQGVGISAWIGVSNTNTNPDTWTNWTPATYNVDVNNNDEYQAPIGSGLSPGTYYYASRFQVA